MARVRSIINFSGKLGDEVHVESKHGNLVRKAPKKGTKKDESAFEQQSNRTGFLNNLAGELNRIISAYSGRLKPSDFYQALQKRFRKEPLNNRFLLLRQLQGMEVHPGYPFKKLGEANVTVEAMTKKIMVRLQVLLHAPKYVGRYTVNCYAYEVCLLCWRKSEEPVIHARQFGEWIYLKDSLPEFEFEFPRPADTVHWLVCVKQQAGVNEEPVPSFRAEGMQIVTAGTFDKKDMALLTKRKEEEGTQAKKAAKNNQEQIIRIKAKR